MSEFITALCSNARSGRIPEEYDFFGSLIGEGERRMDIFSSLGRYGSARSFHRSLPCGAFTKQTA